jgi:hypothetical protein
MMDGGSFCWTFGFFVFVFSRFELILVGLENMTRIANLIIGSTKSIFVSI